MSILVTGGAGFIGSHCVERLLRDTDATVVSLDSYNASYDPLRKRRNTLGFATNPRVTLVQGDFCNEPLVEELFARHAIEYVIHLGAYGGVRYSVDHPAVYVETNVGGTLTLLEAARRSPVKRFILASSSTVYGCGAAAPFVEDAPLGIPASPYGVSKRAAELLGATYFALHGVPVVALRLFSVYGPRLRPDLALSVFTGRILAAEQLPLHGDGSIRRDFTHVSDVCSGILAAMTASGVEGQAINIGHDEPVAIGEMIRLLERSAGLKARIDYRPEVSGDLPLTHADLTKARRLLNYRPLVSFEEGVRQYVAWYRSELGWHSQQARAA